MVMLSLVLILDNEGLGRISTSQMAGATVR